MKKIIDGKRYDTEKATLVAEWDNGLGYSDFGWCETSLYCTQNGSWFLAGEGGALSEWSEPCGNNGRGGGSGIKPLSELEAREWLEWHEFTDELEEYFKDALVDA